MNNTILPKLPLEELRRVLREELNACLSNKLAVTSNSLSKELLNIKGASEYLNLTSTAIYKLVHRKQIPYMKRSRRLYFSKDELREWVEEGRKPTEAALKAAAQAHLVQLHHSKKRS